MRRFLVRVDPLEFTVSSDPVPFVDGEVSVFLAGFVANRVDLQRRLGVECSAAECDDVRLFARAYLRWGSDVSRHVLGQYAAAAIDRSSRSVLIAQDSLGLHSHYYSFHKGHLYFASHLPDLAACIATRDLDEEYLADFIATSLPSSGLTPFRGIHRLCFGETKVWRGGQFATSRPWTPSSASSAGKTPQDREETFRDLVKLAVTSVLPSDRKTWCEVSGGLDSSTVLAEAAGQSSPIESVSFVYDSRRLTSDQEWIDVMRASYPVPAHTVTLQEHAPFSSLPVKLCGEPGGEIVSAVQMAYDRLLAEHQVTTVLTGHGGDSVLGAGDYSPHYLADHLLSGAVPRLITALRGIAANHEERRGSFYWLRHYAIGTALRHARGELILGPWLKPLPSWLAPEYVRTMHLADRLRRQRTPRLRQPGRQALWQDAFLDAFVQAICRPLHNTAEFRHPLFFRPLVEFMLSIPYAERQLPQGDRVLQRRALTGILPEPIRLRTTKGSARSVYDRQLHASREWLDILTERPRIVDRGYVQAGEWKSEVQRARFGATYSIKHFYSVAALEAWLRLLETESFEAHLQL